MRFISPWLGSEATDSFQYITPNKTVVVESVQCSGVEKALTNCAYNTLSLNVGKQKLTQSNMAGVSCKKATSTISPSTSSSPTPSLETQANSTPYNVNYIIFGVLGSTTLIGVILLLV